MTDVIVHMGLHKTGSTAIQRMMATNKIKLSDRGVLYPTTGRVGAGHHDLAWSFNRKPEQMPLWIALRSEISRSNPRQVVVSSEEFESLNTTERWSRLRDELEEKARVVCYLRRQDDYVISSYHQHVKTGATHPIAQHERKIAPRLDYAARLASIEAAIGKAAMIVRPYEKQQLPGGVLPDFLAAIGLEGAELDLPKFRVNPSLSVAGFNIMMDINKAVADKSLRQTLARFIWLHAFAASEVDKPNLLSLDARAEIVARYAEGNAEVARRYLGREDGALFYDAIG